MPQQDFKYWQDRAEETRSAALRASDPHVRRTLIQIAESYEELAERARQMATKNGTHQGASP